MALPARIPEATATPREGNRPCQRLIETRDEGIRANDLRSAELMCAFQARRDSECFARLYELNAPRIHRIVTSCLRAGARDIDRDEVTHEVFVHIFRSASTFRFEHEGSFRSWSAQIARNAVRHSLRERQRRSGMGTALLLEQFPARRQYSEELEVLHAAESALPVLFVAMAKALEECAARDRAVLDSVLAAPGEYGAIAASMGLRRATLRMVICRARQRLLERVERILQRASR